jgi:hypothetical protein
MLKYLKNIKDRKMELLNDKIKTKIYEVRDTKVMLDVKRTLKLGSF